jgi:hypothetical protein
MAGAGAAADAVTHRAAAISLTAAERALIDRIRDT